MKTVSLATFSNTPNALASFKKNYGEGVATALGIPSNQVTVTSVSVTQQRRVLASVSVSVTYVVVVPAGVSAADLTSNISAVQSSGKLDVALASSGVRGAVTTPASYVDLSPTSAPTTAPTLSPTDVALNALPTKTAALIGGLVGGAGGMLLLILAIYLVYKTVRPKIYINAEPIREPRATV